MPSTRLTASSMTSEICVSTSSTEAPGRLVRTMMVGRSTAGKRSTPSLKKEAAPTTTSARMIMAAKTGRAMQVAASVRMVGTVERYGAATVTASPSATLPPLTTTTSPSDSP